MIKYELIDGVGKITLNRPNKYNAFVRDMALEFHRVIDKCKEDPNVRAILITGEGKAFCAGQDLEEAIDPNGPDLTQIVREHYNPIITKIRNIEKPVIAAVNGVAAGAGANIALSCDIVIATQSAVFIQAFSKIGLIPDSAGTFFLPRLVGLQRATALMMTGEPVGASKAVEIGMIYKYYSDESFKEESLQFSSKLAKMPTFGLGLTKKLLNSTFSNNLNEQLEMEDECQTLAGKSYDFKEGVQAFLEKRKAVFKGE